MVVLKVNRHGKVRFLAEAFRVLRPPGSGGAGGRLLLDNSIVTTGDQHGVFSKQPIALVSVPAGAAGPGLPREDKVLSLEHFLLRCCSAPAHEAWARKAAAAAPGSVLPAAQDWRAALGVRRWDIRRVRQPSGSHALVLSKRSGDPVRGLFRG